MNIVEIGTPFAYDRRDGTPLAAVWHIAEGSLDACDGWFNNVAQNTDGLAAHVAISRFRPGLVHRYARGFFSTHSCGIRDGAAPPDHGYAKWLLEAIGPVASPNRFTYNIEGEGKAGWRLDADILATSIDYGYFLWCGGGTRCPHDQGDPDHGLLYGQPCDRYHNLRHGEIGGHPLCPGYLEMEMEALVAGIQSKLVGAPMAIPQWAIDALSAQDNPEGDDMQTHAMDSGQTNEALNEIGKKFGDVLFDNMGATMLAVTEAKGITIPQGRKAVLVIY